MPVVPEFIGRSESDIGRLPVPTRCLTPRLEGKFDQPVPNFDVTDHHHHLASTQMASQANSQRPPIRALLIDISGTLLIGSSPTPGAVWALAELRAAHIPFRLCSNTSKESSDAVHERMRAAGLDVRREELWTSVSSLRAVLKALGVKR